MRDQWLRPPPHDGLRFTVSDARPELSKSPPRGLPVIRVLIVEDHQFFRQCLADIINASDDLEAVGECGDGSEVTAAVRELCPDVVLMDLRLSPMSGIEATAALHRDQARARVLMLTSDPADTSRAAARANGAAGYLLKGWGGGIVVRAIRHIAAGGTIWAKELDHSCTTAF
jgi:DNA-binding NarL/FixJ family response regulator